MADEMILQCDGLTKLIETFRAYFTDIDTSPIMIAAMAKIGAEIEAEAKQNLLNKIYNTPEGWYERSGFLKANLKADKPTGGGGELAVTVRAQEKYAIYVEMGTGIYGTGKKRAKWFYKSGDGKTHISHGMKARPFLLPALQIKANRAQQILEEALTEFLNTKVQL
ncbi:MAG: HK97 gp10 family phage protein [Dehalococcoidales bacterium]|nr:HK97 gp10 family phage protein [Dehalococcoidales bacterium]